jgi:hypothetical protein
MNRFIESFEHWETAQNHEKWTISGGSVNSTGRNGKGYGGAASNQVLSKTFGDPQSTWIAGLAYKTTNFSNNIMSFTNVSGLDVNLVHVGDGRLRITQDGGTSTNSDFEMNVNKWYYFELKIVTSRAAPLYIVASTARANGVTILTVTTTHTYTGEDFNVVNFGSPGGGHSAAMDDIYINDGQGSYNNDFAGDVKILPIYPDGTGAIAEWTPSSTATGNWDLVNEKPAPDSDTSYVYTNTVSSQDLYNFEDIPSVAQVLAVQLSVYASKDDAGTRKFKALYRDDATAGTSTTSGTATSTNLHSVSLGNYLYFRENWDINPVTTATWSYVEVNSGQWGMELDT